MPFVSKTELLRPFPSLPALGLDAVELLLLLGAQDGANADAGAFERRLELELDRLPDLDDVPVRLGGDGAHLVPLGGIEVQRPGKPPDDEVHRGAAPSGENGLDALTADAVHDRRARKSAEQEDQQDAEDRFPSFHGRHSPVR